MRHYYFSDLYRNLPIWFEDLHAHQASGTDAVRRCLNLHAMCPGLDAGGSYIIPVYETGSLTPVSCCRKVVYIASDVWCLMFDGTDIVVPVPGKIPCVDKLVNRFRMIIAIAIAFISRCQEPARRVL